MGKFADTWAVGYGCGSLAWFLRPSVPDTGLPFWSHLAAITLQVLRNCQELQGPWASLPSSQFFFILFLPWLNTTDSSIPEEAPPPFSLPLFDLVALNLGEKNRETLSDAQSLIPVSEEESVGIEVAHLVNSRDQVPGTCHRSREEAQLWPLFLLHSSEGAG